MVNTSKVTADRFLITASDGALRADIPSSTPLLMVSEAKAVVPVTISFPNFNLAAPRYHYASGGTGGGPPFKESCATYVVIDGQEWGPGLANHLAPTVIATVPADTNTLDIQSQLTRTKVPDQVLSSTPIALPSEGELTSSDQDIRLEWSGLFRRQITITLEGTDVVLRRFQSVPPGSWLVKEIQYQYNGDVFYTAPNPPFPHQVFWNLRQSDPGACSLSGTVDLSSIWTGTLTIIPTRYRP